MHLCLVNGYDPPTHPVKSLSYHLPSALLGCIANMQAIFVLLLCMLSIANVLSFSHVAAFRSSSPVVSNSLHMSEADVNEVVVELPKSDLANMEIRVGKIVEISTHPEADTLFVEKVDLAEKDGPRTIVSGLVNYCKAEDLLNRQVVVLCNLKPRAMRGITSAGMLLCASNEDHSEVEPLLVPDNVPLGELITFDGHRTNEYLDPGNKSTKVWGKIADKFIVDENGVATYDGTPFKTSGGPIKSTKIKGSIS